MQLVEIIFPAGGRICFDETLRTAPVFQQIWVLEGQIDIAQGAARHHLEEGDCLAMQLEGPHCFHNPSHLLSRYIVAIYNGLASSAKRTSL